MKKHYKRLSEKEFNQIKKLLGMHLTVRQVAGVVNRSPGIVNLVKRASTMGDYYAIIHKYTMKNVAPKPENVAGQSETQEIPEKEKNSWQNDSLLLLALNRIANALEGIERNAKPQIFYSPGGGGGADS